MFVDVGQTLRQSRLRSGLTLRQLAERAGTSHSTLAAYESNAKVPRADTMYRILEAAGWNVVVTSMGELSWQDRADRGEILEALLRLTDHFPTRRGEPLGPARFGAAES